MIWQRCCRLILASLFVLAISSLCWAAETPRIVAKVGSIPVTVYDLQRRINKIIPLQGSFHSGVSAEKMAKIKSQAYEELIERALKVQYALDEEISVPPGSLKEKMKPYRKRFKTDEELSRALGGETIDEFRAALYRGLLAAAAEKQAVTDKVSVSEERVKKYYQENKSRFMRPRQFHASHILVKVDPSSSKEERAKLKKKAEDLAARAKAGEDFFNLAYYNSDDRSKWVGGDLGLFHEGQSLPEFEAALKKMKPGEIVGPVKSLYGYHIIKLHKINPPTQLSYDDMAKTIRMKLEKEDRDQLYEKWISSLKKKYKVERFLK
ncbi:peptidylprolyl isomerase [Geothermobacter hydrogeniphilus]|uniref:PpiC domain-containing protein n=1 Tax=Geothermobacter hydrogeniphilus TaxID=1969733 RepID=A0A1X0YCR5_9BACT|nr:peptidylprolyl isomerase [Geothermobacter hydrogeniphilus]ORJ62917.1 hypothetical protein B5V00_02345 [Geothermobacter hydrogeniphilus]